jgi:hypothetical protein
MSDFDIGERVRVIMPVEDYYLLEGVIETNDGEDEMPWWVRFDEHEETQCFDTDELELVCNDDENYVVIEEIEGHPDYSEYAALRQSSYAAALQLAQHDADELGGKYVVYRAVAYAERPEVLTKEFVA